LKYFVVFFILISTHSAFAACTQGLLTWDGTNMKYCYDGTNYRNVDSTSTAVACTTLGQIEYSAPNLRSVAVVPLAKMQGGTTFGACASGAGYYYFGSPTLYYWYCDGTNWLRVP
jgi:hypothetical protein